MSLDRITQLIEKKIGRNNLDTHLYEIIDVVIDDSGVSKSYTVKTIPAGYEYDISYFMAYAKADTEVTAMKVDDLDTGFYAAGTYAELNLKNYFGDFVTAKNTIKITAKSTSGNEETRSFVIYCKKRVKS